MMDKLAIVKSDGSQPARVLTAAFDRAITSPRFSSDGKWIYAMTADDRAQPLVRVRVSDGQVERVITAVNGLAGAASLADVLAALAVP